MLNFFIVFSSCCELLTKLMKNNLFLVAHVHFSLKSLFWSVYGEAVCRGWAAKPPASGMDHVWEPRELAVMERAVPQIPAQTSGKVCGHGWPC